MRVASDARRVLYCVPPNRLPSDRHVPSNLRRYAMKTLRPKFTAAFLLTAVSSFAFVLATAADARAQRGGAAPQRDLSSTERDIRALESATEKKKDAKTTMTEVNEDFGRLRAINDELKSASSSGAALNYKSISDTSVR